MPAPELTQARAIILAKDIRDMELANAGGVAQPTARKWISGVSKPGGAATRTRIAKKFPELKPHFWDLLVALPPGFGEHNDAPEHAGAFAFEDGDGPEDGIQLAPYVPEDCDLMAPGAARSMVIAQITRLRADMILLRAARADASTVGKAESEIRRAALDLAKLAGELSPNEHARIVKSAQWRQIRDAMLDALDNYPDALAAVLDALAAVDAS